MAEPELAWWKFTICTDERARLLPSIVAPVRRLKKALLRFDLEAAFFGILPPQLHSNQARQEDGTGARLVGSIQLAANWLGRLEADLMGEVRLPIARLF